MRRRKKCLHRRKNVFTSTFKTKMRRRRRKKKNKSTYLCNVDVNSFFTSTQNIFHVDVICFLQKFFLRRRIKICYPTSKATQGTGESDCRDEGRRSTSTMQQILKHTGVCKIKAKIKMLIGQLKMQIGNFQMLICQFKMLIAPFYWPLTV